MVTKGTLNNNGLVEFFRKKVVFNNEPLLVFKYVRITKEDFLISFVFSEKGHFQQCSAISILNMPDVVVNLCSSCNVNF